MSIPAISGNNVSSVQSVGNTKGNAETEAMEEIENEEVEAEAEEAENDQQEEHLGTNVDAEV